ncbi:MAG TPA: hypothetical protein VGD37_29410 [Kofleriaceae bacterium]
MSSVPGRSPSPSPDRDEDRDGLDGSRDEDGAGSEDGAPEPARAPSRPTLTSLFGPPHPASGDAPVPSAPLRGTKPDEDGRDSRHRRRKKKTREDRIPDRDKRGRGEKRWERERRQDRGRKEELLSAVPEDDGRAEAEADAEDPGVIDIQGVRNSGTDCFLNASLQLLAGSYRGILDADLDLTDDLRAWLNAHAGGNASVQRIAALRGQLEAPDPDLAQIAAAANHPAQNVANACRDLEKMLTKVYLHGEIRDRVTALLDAINDPDQPIEPQAARELRTYLRQFSPPIVPSVIGHEDAQETLNGLLSLLLHGAGNRIQMAETWTVLETQLPDVDEPPDGGIVQYDHNDQTTRPLGAESMLQVPIADHGGLIAYLRALFGAGYDEVVNERGGLEWANVHGQDTTVTRRHVVRKFTALPDVLTIQLQRALPNGVKVDKQFDMPELVTLIEDGADGEVAKRYRLKSFVFHTGASTFGGHYWTHTRRNERWMRADDSRVTSDRQARDAEDPDEREIEHDINHGYIYTYEIVAGDEPAMPDDVADGEALDRESLPEAAEPDLEAAPAHGGRTAHTGAARARARARQRQPLAGGAAATLDQGPHQITQCGFMTGDMFIICSALRLDRQLSVQVLWDTGYYLAKYEERCKAEGLSLVDLYNRDRPDPKTAEEATAELRGRMERNARNIERFYLDAGIDPKRIKVVKVEGSARDQYKKTEKGVFPTEKDVEPDPFNRLPGFATSTVQHAFKNDLYAARNAVYGMFGGLSDERKKVIEKLREDRVGNKPVALIWSRATYRKTSNGNPGLDTDPDVMADLIRLIAQRCADRTAFVVGDPVFDAPALVAQTVKAHGLIEYWNAKDLPGGNLTYLEQMYFLHLLHERNQAIAIGMISGVIEIPALLGMPTFYFELSSMREKGVRWSKMSGKGRPRGGAIPNLNQIELSGDMEHAARLRSSYADLRAWLVPAGQAAGPTLSAEATQRVIAAFTLATQPTHGSFRIDPDADPDGEQHTADMARVDAAAQALAEARAGGRPAAVEAPVLDKLDAAVRAALQSHAMTPGELADLGTLITTWETIEEVQADNAEELARLKPAELVARLHRLRPGAAIDFDGSAVVINGSLTLAIEDLRMRMMIDLRWILRQIDGQTERPMTAEQPLALVAEPRPILVKAREASKVQAQFDAIGKILGDTHFAGLIQDLATLAGALDGLLASVDLPAAALAAELIGPAALAGALTELKTNPGKLRVFLEGTIARRRELEGARLASLDGARVLHSQLVMPAHRAALAGRDENLRNMATMRDCGDEPPPDMRPSTRELDKRTRTPQEISQAHLLREEVDDYTPVLTTGAGYSRGNGRRLELGMADEGDAVGVTDGSDAQQIGVLPLEPGDRRSKKYDEILAAVYGLQIVGATRSGMAELADVFMAAFKTRSTPRFLTASSAILDALGLRAGLPMASRDLRQSYAAFLAENAYPTEVGREAYAATSFTVELCGARVEVAPIDTVRMPGSDKESSLMRLAHSHPEFSGQRIYDGMALEIAPHADPKKLQVGHLHGYTEAGAFRIEIDGSLQTISPDVYAVRIAKASKPPPVPGVPVAEVEKLFDRPEIGAKLRKLIKQLIAKDVSGIEHFSVAQYMELIRNDGFVSYVVGGAVRDIVKGGKDPADVDLVTTMPAVDVASTFQRAGLADPKGEDGLPAMRTIGFRGITQVEHQAEDGLDVVSMHAHEAGTSALSLTQDVGNRDFTINALFYDPVSQEVIDPTKHGLTDLKSGTLRWVCQVLPGGGDDAVRAKIRDGAYQAARWIKFRLRGLEPAQPGDARVVNEEIGRHVAGGITPEERAYFLDTMGVPIETAVKAAAGIGLDPALLQRLAPALSVG